MQLLYVFFFQAEDGIRDYKVTGVQTCALPISGGAVADAALVLGAMSAAKDVAGRLDPVPDDLAAAMRARGRHRLDRAFEAVEGHRAAGALDLERLVVIVAADIASGHCISPQKSSCPANGGRDGEAQGRRRALSPSPALRARASARERRRRARAQQS